MQPATSDKTFHLKWNNHLQNLSQLFTTIYSSSALADVTLSCRDGSIRAHKLVLSACSPYFEQIFKDNPCKHPVIILKGIPYSEINQLVEFMYKGSVDVQELDLQSLMHTASELEIRGLAYELRKDASSLLNVNLNEYPTFASTPNVTQESATPAFESNSRVSNISSFDSAQRTVNPYQTNLERLRQIHMYQQTMCRNTPYSQTQVPSTSEQTSDASAIKRKRKNEDSMPVTTTNAVKNILAAAAKELAEKKNFKHKTSTCIQTDDAASIKVESDEMDCDDMEPEVPLHGRDTRFKGKKRVSVGLHNDYSSLNPNLVKNKPGKRNVKFTIDTSQMDSDDGNDESTKPDSPDDIDVNQSGVSGTLKCVDLDNLRDSNPKSAPDADADDDNDDSSALDTSDENNLLVERGFEYVTGQEDDYDSCDSKPGSNQKNEKVFKCDLCELSYSRNSHMLRHRRTHAGERPFKCNTCPFSFNRSSHLARHRRTHTGERPYRCEACGRCFARGDKLKLHMRICEKDEYMLPSQSTNIESNINKQVKKELTQTMVPGMVAIGHSERHQLMFTPSGEVMLAPRSLSESVNDTSTTLNDTCENNQSANASVNELKSPKINVPGMMTPTTLDNSLLSSPYYSVDAAGYPIKRGRGRPRKKPLPPVETPLIKKKRGRPPKVIKLDPLEPTMTMENYNASNLPYGDFSYLTDIISTHFNQSSQQSYHNMMQLNPIIDGNKFPGNSLGNVVSKAPSLSTMTPQSALHNIDIAKVQAAFRENVRNQNIITQVVRQANSNDVGKDKVMISTIGKVDMPKPTQIILPDLPNETIIQHSTLITSDESDNLNTSKSDNTVDMHETMDISSQEAESFGGKKIKSNVMMVGDCQIVKIQGAYESSKAPDNSTKSDDVATVGECTIKPVL